MFDCTKENTIHRKIAFITDIDPARKERNKENAKYQKCYPFEMNINLTEYEYTVNSTEKYKKGKHSTICSFTQDKEYGKTFEFQLAFENATSEILITPSLSNADELTNLMNMVKEKKSLDEMLKSLRSSDENKRISNSLLKSKDFVWDDDSKKKALIASRYLNSVEKGENALELSSALRENLTKKGTPEFKAFNVPMYIREAIEWMCEDK